MRFVVGFVVFMLFVGMVFFCFFAGLQVEKAREMVLEVEQAIEVTEARNQELERRSLDRDTIELELRQCLQERHTDLSNLDSIQWQMDIVLKTCPGRARPPKAKR